MKKKTVKRVTAALMGCVLALAASLPEPGGAALYTVRAEEAELREEEADLEAAAAVEEALMAGLEEDVEDWQDEHVHEENEPHTHEESDGEDEPAGEADETEYEAIEPDEAVDEPEGLPEEPVEEAPETAEEESAEYSEADEAVVADESEELPTEEDLTEALPAEEATSPDVPEEAITTEEAVSEILNDSGNWYDSYDYTIEGNLLVLTNYRGSEGTVYVPATAQYDGITYSVALRGGVYGNASINSIGVQYGRGTPVLQSISFESGVKLLSGAYMFYSCTNLTSFDGRGLDTSGATSMEDMFSGCSSLEKLDLSSFDTSNVQNMNEMFSYCESLNELNLSSFDTRNTTPNNMFRYDSLKVLYTPKYMGYMACYLYKIMYEKNTDGSYKTKKYWNLGGDDGAPAGTIIYAAPMDTLDFAVVYFWPESGSYTDPVAVYDGTPKEPAPTVCAGDGVTRLTRDQDYRVEYSDNIEVGWGKAKIVGIGSYTGSTVAVFEIVEPDWNQPKNITTGSISLSQDSYVFDGSAKTPAVAVRVKDNTLANGQDYTVVYQNNVHAGTAKAIITGKGNYTGTKELAFSIQPLAISGAAIVLSETRYAYDGKEKKPSATVTFRGQTLTRDSDYTLTYKNNKKAGTARVNAIGKGDYTGSVSGSFQICKYNLSKAKIAVAKGKLTYDGKAKRPSVKVTIGKTTLKSGKHYTISYKNNINAGKAQVTVAGKGDCAGTKSASFSIGKRSIDKSSLSVTTKSVPYTGTAKTPAVTLSCGGRKLSAGKDFTLSYKGNRDVGTATVVAKAKGNYTGSKKGSFKITKGEQNFNVSGDAVGVGQTTTIRTTGAAGGITFKSSDASIASVSKTGVVSGKKEGIVNISVEADGTKNYNAAKKTITFKVMIGAPEVLAATTVLSKQRKIRVVWSAVEGATGYVVYRDGTKLADVEATTAKAYSYDSFAGTSHVFSVAAKGKAGVSTLTTSVRANWDSPWCTTCKGNGECNNCSGNGVVMGYLPGVYFRNGAPMAGTVTCTTCSGSGKCLACGGTGMRNGYTPPVYRNK